MTTAIEEQIKKAEERLAALKAKAAETPKRQVRSLGQIQEIMLLEGELVKRYGIGFPGLASITRKAKKDGVKPLAPAKPAAPTTSAANVTTTTEATMVEPDENDEGGVTMSTSPTSPPPAPAEAVAEPETEETPVAAAVAAADPEGDVPW